MCTLNWWEVSFKCYIIFECIYQKVLKQVHTFSSCCQNYLEDEFMSDMSWSCLLFTDFTFTHKLYSADYPRFPRHMHPALIAICNDMIIIFCRESGLDLKFISGQFEKAAYLQISHGRRGEQHQLLCRNTLFLPLSLHLPQGLEQNFH